jgi:alpha-tubulin suppressor-like RCC1 family protein
MRGLWNRVAVLSSLFLVSGCLAFEWISLVGTGRADETSVGALASAPRRVIPGVVRGWGFNDEGQLGDGSKTDRNSAVDAIGLGQIVGISAGSRFSVAEKADGTVWTWGYNYTGQLGDGYGETRPEPRAVEGLTDVIAVSAGSSHVLALKRDGTVWAWGFGKAGQLGHGATGDPNAKENEETLYAFGRPTEVLGLSHIVAISAGAFHSLALDSSGSIWAWGNNEHGELATNLGQRSAFATRVPIKDRIVAISAGYWHNLALSGDSSVWGWGCNYSGQLAVAREPATYIIRDPIRLSQLRNIRSIAAGRVHNLAIDGNGNAWSWGSNEFGVLANGTPPEEINVEPKQVIGIGQLVSVATGYNHSAALKLDGSIWTWGSNEYDMLGDGSRIPLGRMRRILRGMPADYGVSEIASIPRRSFPAQVIDAGQAYAVSSSPSGWHTLALKE